MENVIIIPQVRMLKSDWLVSYVVLLIPHGWQTAGGLKMATMFAFRARHQVFFTVP
jgi:hypothetical protein